MLISFFEEFPIKENLNKLSLINFPTKLYLAAKSLQEFNKIKSTIKNKFIKEFIYWPILEKSEGYWISPFTKRSALKRIFNELENQSTPTMLDLEWPLTKNPLLLFTQAINFFRNKKLIRNFVNNYNGKIYLCEYYPEGKKKDWFLEKMGLHYNNQKAKVIKMLYHSMHPFNNNFIKKELQKGKELHQDNFIVSFGTIATGINGNEPILSKEQLNQDLKIAKEENIQEVIIFRLGGLIKEYLNTIKKYI